MAISSRHSWRTIKPDAVGCHSRAGDAGIQRRCRRSSPAHGGVDEAAHVDLLLNVVESRIPLPPWQALLMVSRARCLRLTRAM